MIFDPRRAYKPFEYPEVMQYVSAINNSFWVHNEVNFTADIQEFKTTLSPEEQEVIKRALLAISQIEVTVKTFWGDLYRHLPKPEFNNLGSTFAENETRHSEAYSRLIEVLGLNNEFESLFEVPVVRKRIDYLSNALKTKQYSWLDKLLIKFKLKKDTSKEDYLIKVILFSILIENVSLFSQFAIMLSFTKFKGIMKKISNIIAWTSVDEQIHALGGVFIINKIKQEYPELLTDDIIKSIVDMVKTSIEVESEMLDWIFDGNEIETVNKKDLLNFMKFRVDDSLSLIGLDKIYNVSEDDMKPMFWFDEEIKADTLDDFFPKRPVEYTKHDRPISADDLF